MRTHRPPTRCPVCSTSLITLRLGCPNCATELSGHFDSCRYCRLDASDLAILEAFLRGRGNVRDVQAFLGVSYPTARARLGEVLDRLGLAEPPVGAPVESPAEPPASTTAPPSPAGATPAGGSGREWPASVVERTAAILADVAAGRMDPADAEDALIRLRTPPPAPDRSPVG